MVAQPSVIEKKIARHFASTCLEQENRESRENISSLYRAIEFDILTEANAGSDSNLKDFLDAYQETHRPVLEKYSFVPEVRAMMQRIDGTYEIYSTF